MQRAIPHKYMENMQTALRARGRIYMPNPGGVRLQCYAMSNPTQIRFIAKDSTGPSYAFIV